MKTVNHSKNLKTCSPHKATKLLLHLTCAIATYLTAYSHKNKHIVSLFSSNI